MIYTFNELELLVDRIADFLEEKGYHWNPGYGPVTELDKRSYDYDFDEDRIDFVISHNRQPVMQITFHASYAKTDNKVIEYVNGFEEEIKEAIKERLSL